jgi:hypothetical protein
MSGWRALVGLLGALVASCFLATPSTAGSLGRRQISPRGRFT